MSGEHGGHGRTRAGSIWRVHVDRSRASDRADAHGLGKRRAGAAGFGEALYDLLPVAGCGVPERDPTVEIDPFERTGRRVALCPPRVGQVLLRRVRDAARPQEEGAPTRPDDDRFQRAQELVALVEHGLLDHLIRPSQQRLRDRKVAARRQRSERL